MSSQMPIRRKLFLCFGAIIAVTITTVILAFWSVNGLGTTIREVLLFGDKRLYLSSQIDRAALDIIGQERGILLWGLLKDTEKRDKYYREFQQTSVGFKKTLDELGPMLVSEEGKRLRQEMLANYGKIVEMQGALYHLVCEAKFDDARLLSDNLTVVLTKVSQDAEMTMKRVVDRQLLWGKSADAQVSRTAWLLGTMLGLALLVGAGALFVTRRIDLSLMKSVTALSNASQQVAGAASQVSTSSQALAQGASEQAASLQETSASTEEVTSRTRQNAESSKKSAHVMLEMSGGVADGNRKLTEMIDSMNDINASSEKISKIIRTIDEIAFQTNILALNAAVEAARAGEAGMGFAVVADEVRNLAQRSAQAAKDTAHLIEESVLKSQEGSRKLDEVAKAVAAVTVGAEKVKALVDEVSVGSEQQAHGLEQIAKVISQIEQVTQKTAASAEESAAAGEELTSQSATLRGVAADLAAMVGADTR